MSVLNRILVVILLLAVVAAAVLVVGIVLGLTIADPAIVGTTLADNVNRLRDLTGVQQVGVGVGAIFTIIVALILLRFELLPTAPRPFLIEASGLGEVTVDRASVCQLVERTILHIDEVEAAKVRVRIGKAGLRFDCRVVASNTALLDELGERVQSATRERVQTQIGLPVEEVKSRFRLSRPDERVLL